MPSYIKQTIGHIHWFHPSMNSHSLISHISLSLLKKSTLSLRDLVMAPAFFNGIDMLSSPIFYLYSFDLYLYSCFFAFYIYIFLFLAFDLYLIMLPHFTWKNFLCIYFMFIFFAFYRSGGMNNGPPPPQELDFHPGDEPFAPNVAIPRSLFQLLYEIFFNIFFMLTNNCN